MGNSEIASISYKDLPSQLTKGNKVLIDDGKVSLEVIETNDTDIKCKVLVGGEISNHKGINIPNVHLDFDYLSEQDKLDLQFGVKEDVDFVAASFVRSKDDVVKLRNYLDYIGGNNIKIISKIENIEGVDNFDEILNHQMELWLLVVIWVSKWHMKNYQGYKRNLFANVSKLVKWLSLLLKC